MSAESLLCIKAPGRGPAQGVVGAKKKYHPGLESQEVVQEEAMILWRPEGCQVKHRGSRGVETSR